MTALAPAIYVLAFLAVVLLVQTAAGVLFASSDRTRRVNRRLTMLQSGKTRDEVFSALAQGQQRAQIGGFRLAKLHDWARVYLRQAGVTMAPERLLLTVVGVAGAMWLVALMAGGRAPSGIAILLNGVVSLVAALFLSGFGAWFWLTRKRSKRLRKIEEQLPVGLDIINRAIRAGHPVMSAIQLAAEELGDPLGTEFGLIVDETTYGVDLEQALVNFAHRTGSNDAHFFAVSVSVQATTGGNLAEILEGLSKVIGGRSTLGKRVKALSSEGRASALVISAMPVFVVGVQMLANPRIYIDKFSDPIFWPVVLATAGVYAGGWLIVHRIINFRY